MKIFIMSNWINGLFVIRCFDKDRETKVIFNRCIYREVAWVDDQLRSYSDDKSSLAFFRENAVGCNALSTGWALALPARRVITTQPWISCVQATAHSSRTSQAKVVMQKAATKLYFVWSKPAATKQALGSYQDKAFCVLFGLIHFTGQKVSLEFSTISQRVLLKKSKLDVKRK